MCSCSGLSTQRHEISSPDQAGMLVHGWCPVALACRSASTLRSPAVRSLRSGGTEFCHPILQCSVQQSAPNVATFSAIAIDVADHCAADSPFTPTCTHDDVHRYARCDVFASSAGLNVDIESKAIGTSSKKSNDKSRHRARGTSMKGKSIAVCCLCLISCVAFARGSGSGGGHHSYRLSSNSEHYVHGYTRSNGTYVSGYHQTNPNGTKSDNWSSKGNVNPYTGKSGTVDPSK